MKRYRASTGARRLALALAAFTAFAWSTATATADVVSYQQGDGKGVVSDTDDATVNETSSGTNYGTAVTCNVDQSGHQHCLVKFPNIFGNGANQIPPGSTIQSATLTMYVSRRGHRLPDRLPAQRGLERVTGHLELQAHQRALDEWRGREHPLAQGRCGGGHSLHQHRGIREPHRHQQRACLGKRRAERGLGLRQRRQRQRDRLVSSEEVTVPARRPSCQSPFCPRSPTPSAPTPPTSRPPRRRSRSRAVSPR